MLGVAKVLPRLNLPGCASAVGVIIVSLRHTQAITGYYLEGCCQLLLSGAAVQWCFAYVPMGRFKAPAFLTVRRLFAAFEELSTAKGQAQGRICPSKPYGPCANVSEDRRFVGLWKLPVAQREQLCRPWLGPDCFSKKRAGASGGVHCHFEHSLSLASPEYKPGQSLGL